MQVDGSLQNQNLYTDLRWVDKRIRKSAHKFMRVCFISVSFLFAKVLFRLFFLFFLMCLQSFTKVKLIGENACWARCIVFKLCGIFRGFLHIHVVGKPKQSYLSSRYMYFTHFVMLTFSQISGAEKLPAGEGVSAEFVGWSWTLCFYNEEQVCRPE